MFNLPFGKTCAQRLLQIIAIIAVVVSTIGVFNFTSNGSANGVQAATVPVSINMIYYGWNTAETDQSIINANPEYIVNNSPAGPWNGNANINTFMSAGIKYFEYIDGGYEGTIPRSIPNDLQSNLNYIDAIARAGAYGVFVDEVSSYPSAASLNYLKQLADRAHSLGLKVAFNTGVDLWSDSLMDYCDIMQSSEVWSNATLSSSQTKWKSRTWFLTQNVNDAATAANLTLAAWSKGIEAAYVCNSYGALPSWLASYIALIQPFSSSQYTLTTEVTGQGSVTINPVQSTYNPGSSVQLTATPATGWIFSSWSGGISGSANPVNITINSNTSITANFTSTSTTTPVTMGNTSGTVATKPVPTGATNEYALNLLVTSTTASGVTVGQQIWCAAKTTDFPGLLTVGSSLTGNLDHSLGWWVFTKANTSTTPTITPPSVVTNSASGITMTGATLSGNLITLGSSSSVTVSFEWGLTSSYGNTTTPQTMTTSKAFTATLTGLAAGTTYHFRAKAIGNGTVYGSDIIFTTAGSTTPVTMGNTSGIVATKPVPTGATNEYAFNLLVTSTTASGVTVGQQIWCAAKTTDFPGLLTVGSSLTGNLDHSLGWWVFTSVK